MVDWQPNNGGGDWENEKDWKPDGPAELVGTLVGKSTIDTKYGPTVLLKIEDKDAQVWAVWGSRAGLRTLIEQHDDELVLGREIGLRTEEKMKLKNGNDFVPYQIGFGEMQTPSEVPSEESF